MNGIKFSYTCPRCSTPAKKLDGEDVCLRCGIRLADTLASTGKVAGTVTVQQPSLKPMIVIERATDNERDDKLREMIRRKLQEHIDRLPVTWEEQFKPK